MAVQISGNDITVPRDTTVTRNLTVGGVLTYEDVTNVDSIGIVTARAGVLVGSGITLSKDGDIFATGVTTSTTFVGNLTGNVTGNVTGNISGGTVAGSTGDFTGNLTITNTSPAINLVDSDADDYKIHNVGGLLKITDTTASADRFVINDNGTGYFLSNFQIGSTTTSPGATLHLNTSYPSLKVDSNGHASDAYVAIISGNAQNSRVDFGDSDDADIGMIDYDHANNSMRFLTNTSERLRIDSSGRLLLGHTTSVAGMGGDEAELQVSGTDFSSSSVNLQRYQNNAPAAGITFSKSRNATQGSHTILQDGDEFGKLIFYGSDGNDFANEGARISSNVDGTPGNNVMPGSLRFYTTAQGAVGSSERLRIRSTGVLQVNTTETPGGNPSGGGSNNSNGFLHLMAANTENAMSLSNATTIANNAARGTVLTGINFLNRNYYGTSGRAGTGYVVRNEKGHASYMDRCDLRFVPGYDGQTLYTNRSVVFEFDGVVRPGDDDYASLGKSSAKWTALHATNGTIQTSDENLKQNIQSLSTAEMNAAARISKLFITYKWKKKVAKESAGGDAARIHTGVIAQQVKAALEAEGLTAANYSFWCEDITWKDSEGNIAGDGRISGPGVYDELTGTTPSTDGYTKTVEYAVRYDELLSFVAAYNEQRFTSIESRLDAAGL